MEWIGELLTVTALTSPPTPGPTSTKPPARRRDALERAAVKRRPRVAQHAAGEHWPLGYPLPAPTLPVQGQRPWMASAPSADVLYPISVNGGLPNADQIRCSGGQRDGCAAEGPFPASGCASCVRDGTPQLAMASAQLSSSPLISRLIRQQQCQRPLVGTGRERNGCVSGHVHASRAQSAPVSGPIELGSGRSDATSQQHWSQAQRPSASPGLSGYAGGQVQRQQDTARRPTLSAPVQQPNMPPRQVCSAMFMQAVHQ